MAKITLQGTEFKTIGRLPDTGSSAPGFQLVGSDLAEVGLSDFSGKTVVLNIFPSIDTPVCASSVRRFNEAAGSLADTVVLCVSADLPFAHQRFCEAQGLKQVKPLSVFRSADFGKVYGVTVANGPLAGLLSRAVVVIDRSGSVVYSEQVPEIAQEPDYDAALQAIGKAAG